MSGMRGEGLDVVLQCLDGFRCALGRSNLLSELADFLLDLVEPDTGLLDFL